MFYRYKRLLNSLYSTVRDDPDEAERKKDQTAKGKRGIFCGCKANLFEAMKVLEKAWEKVTNVTIQNCWTKSDILPQTNNQNSCA